MPGKGKPFSKGNSGRPKGSTNIVTGKVRESLALIVQDEIQKLPGYLSQIKKPEVKARILAELLPFVVPKLNSVDMEVNDRETVIRILRE